MMKKIIGFWSISRGLLKPLKRLAIPLPCLPKLTLSLFPLFISLHLHSPLFVSISNTYLTLTFEGVIFNLRWIVLAMAVGGPPRPPLSVTGTVPSHC